MFQYCTDPSILSQFKWFSCYLTSGKHISFYLSFLIVISLICITAPISLFFGFCGSLASRSSFILLKYIGLLYTNIVRGIPDIVFFLFIPITIDQILEYSRHKIMCPEITESVWRGTDFLVCSAAKLPLNSDPQWIHSTYSFLLAILSFSIVFGAFASNTISGAINAVPKSQIVTARSFGMTNNQVYLKIIIPQMWLYALPGLSNLWMLLIKSTPLLFLLGINDIVYWAKEIGGSKTSIFKYPHPDWRVWYFLGLLVFYLLVTKLSEIAFKKISNKINHAT